MQLVTRPLLSALAALLLAVALCSAEIISWQPSGPEPQYFVPEGEVVFSFNAPGSDLQLFASNSTPIDPTFDTLVVFVNGVNVWNVSGASLVSWDFSAVTNITLPNAIPPLAATTIVWQLFTNDTLVDGPWTTTIPPLLAGSVAQVYIATPGNQSAVFTNQIQVTCIFTTVTDFEGKYYYLQEDAEFLDDNTWRCTIDDMDVSELTEFPVATPFLMSVNVSSSGGLFPIDPVVVPATQAFYLNTTSFFYDATSTGETVQYACMKTIWINATGNFYTDRFYSCVVELAFDSSRRVVSSPTLAVNSSLVVCLFNTSSIIYNPTVDHLPFLNSYNLIGLVESTGTMANGSVVAGDYTTQFWDIQSCNKSGSSHSFEFYMLVIGGSGMLATAVVAALVYLVFVKQADPAAAPLLRGQSVNA